MVASVARETGYVCADLDEALLTQLEEGKIKRRKLV